MNSIFYMCTQDENRCFQALLNAGKKITLLPEVFVANPDSYSTLALIENDSIRPVFRTLDPMRYS